MPLSALPCVSLQAWFSQWPQTAYQAWLSPDTILHPKLLLASIPISENISLQTCALRRPSDEGAGSLRLSHRSPLYPHGSLCLASAECRLLIGSSLTTPTKDATSFCHPSVLYHTTLLLLLLCYHCSIVYLLLYCLSLSAYYRLHEERNYTLFIVPFTAANTNAGRIEGT